MRKPRESGSEPAGAPAIADAFELTFECAAVGIAHVSPEGRWQRVNRALCEMLGYSAAELMALRFQDVTHPDDLGEDLLHVRRLLAGESGTLKREKRYLRKDGSIVWVDLSVALVRRPDDSPDHFVSVIVDISERKRIAAELDRQRDRLEELVTERTHQLDAANASLEEQQRLFRTVADSMPGLVGYWGADLRCRYANAAYLAWFARREEEMTGIAIQDLLGPRSATAQARPSRSSR